MIWIMGLLALIIIAVLLGAISAKASQQQSKSKNTASQSSQSATGASRCPLCGSALTQGRKLHSALFPGKADRIMHIFGCPACYPRHETVEEPKTRNCPVCRKQLELTDYLIARMFPPRPGKPKPHVHILGCTRCRERRK